MDLENVFIELRKIMIPYAEKLDCTVNNDNELYINTNHILENNKPLWFGAVQIKKNYVSYHLMPVYINPELLDQISPELKKRMQGKSCFNFTSIDPSLFEELEKLTEASYKDYQEKGFV